jgi:CBS domain-containing protein
MKQLAKHIMQTHVVTLSPDTPLHSAQQVFYDEGIHGAPVISEQGQLVGILSSMDILRAAIEAREISPAQSVHFSNDLDLSHVDWESSPADLQSRLSEALVSDAMSPEVITTPSDTPVSEVARLLRTNRVHRVVVVDGETLCGVISTFDLVGLLEDSA